ncbi:MAG: hypothetical protein ABL959_21685, partial [Pyrinomonadaceae bacterium]
SNSSSSVSHRIHWQARTKRARHAKSSKARDPIAPSLVNAANNIADPSLRESFLTAAAAYLDKT